MRGAGGGRPRKPDDQRRNRNAPSRHDIVVYTDARVAVVPDPPIPLVGRQVPAWEALWREPVATLWSTADVGAVLRMVILQTSAQTYRQSGLLAELRQLEDRFLLNPYSRAQQRVVIIDPPAEEDEDEVVKPSRYEHLKVVGGDK